MPEKADQKRRNRRRLIIVITAAVLAGGAMVLGGQEILDTRDGGKAHATPSPTAEATPTPDSGDGTTAPALDRRDPHDPYAIGNVDAPVVLTEWMDMRCPFCALYARETLPQVIDEYVESGQVRIEFNDISFFGEDSIAGQVAARAAGRQGKYIEYVEAVYADAPLDGHPDLPREKLLGFAETAGVPDLEQFEVDLDSQELLDEANAATADAQELGIGVVPFFHAGGMVMEGSQPIDVFRDYLDQMIDEAQQTE